MIYMTKRILTLLAATLCLCSCNDEHFGIRNKASHAVIAAITGDYSLVSAEWSSPIDLSGKGLVTDDILYQLQEYGWTGILGIRYMGEEEDTSVLYRSCVLSPDSNHEYATQINLYVPYPERHRESEHPLPKADRCNIEIQVYHFYYSVDSKGHITLSGIDDRRISTEGGELTDVNIRFEGEYICFDAETSLYDWSTSTWQDGHMSLKYKHN